MTEVYFGSFSTDAIAPTIVNLFPLNGATSVTPSTNVSFDVLDTGGSGIDLATLDVDIEGAPAILGGVFQAGYTGTITPIANGYAVVLDPNLNFSLGQLVDVDVDVADGAGNPATQLWSFEILMPVLSGLWMDFTGEGATRVSQIATHGLQFIVTHVAYGASGYNMGNPTVALPLVPAATSLVAEVYRKYVPPRNTVLDTIATPRGKEVTYTTVGGDEFTSVLGEAGLFATVTNPGTSGLPNGYQFLLAQAHFPRILFSTYDRLAIRWPLDYSTVALVYNSPLIYDDAYSYNG